MSIFSYFGCTSAHIRFTLDLAVFHTMDDIISRWKIFMQRRARAWSFFNNASCDHVAAKSRHRTDPCLFYGIRIPLLMAETGLLPLQYGRSPIFYRSFIYLSWFTWFLRNDSSVTVATNAHCPTPRCLFASKPKSTDDVGRNELVHRNPCLSKRHALTPPLSGH